MKPPSRALLVPLHTKTTPTRGWDRRLRIAPARYQDGQLRIDPPAG